jgi:hypothetical protein
MAVDALNIDEYLGKVRNRVVLAGVELEGAWKKLPPGVPQLEHDGSVFRGQRVLQHPYVGELPIGPVPPAGLPDLIATNHPDKVDHTCGMHVHMSFANLWQYALLMQEEYQETIVKYLSRWAEKQNNVKGKPEFPPEHHIWSRLKGESEFCQKGFWPDAQAGTKRKDHDRNRYGHRYTIIHYCGRINTIECRVLPMMHRTELAVSAVQEVINITNASLHILGSKYDRKTLVKGKFELPNGIRYEEVVQEHF